MSAKEWKVQFRSCDIWWAAEREHVTDYAPLWDDIPWNRGLTERVTDDEKSARDQFATLQAWERDKSQPVRDVKLLVLEPSMWREVTS